MDNGWDETDADTRQHVHLTSEVRSGAYNEYSATFVNPCFDHENNCIDILLWLYLKMKGQ